MPGLPELHYTDLHRPSGLRRLQEAFVRQLREADPALADEYDRWAAQAEAPPAKALSSLLVRVAPHVSTFVASLFGIQAERNLLRAGYRAHDPVFRFKVDFIRRRAAARLRKAPEGAASAAPDAERLIAALRSEPAWPFDGAPAGADPLATARPDAELHLARFGNQLLDLAAQEKKGNFDAGARRALTGLRAAVARGGAAATPEFADDPALIGLLLDRLDVWCAQRLRDPAGHADVGGWASFRLPQDVDHAALVKVERPRPDDLPEMLIGPEAGLRRRDGFALTDARMEPRDILSEVHYCIYCHERDKDSCSKGLRLPTGEARRNPLGIALDGCPLDEKISEAHVLARQGDPIAALAVIAVDNPMCPGTGHRICNDCMKGCIYQAQDPVNIPQIETGVLTDVLRLPWGVEIYGLLTRWNPLNVRRPYPLPYNGRNVLVVGLGPAGYTLAHHLLNEGFGVVGIDGLKIEPLPVELTGDADRDVPPRPIEVWASIYRDLDERSLEGFGGVSEYGITVRWDKNFLTLLHLTLVRRDKFRMFDGVRFGGTLTVEDAWRLGFHHVAVAAGAGKPTIVGMKNNLIRGIRKASDFLMALQLTGAARRNALANLQVRLPGVVIGGGLTAIDTATEMLAYYPVQVEKVLHRWEAMAAGRGEAKLARLLDTEEREILGEMLAHGRAVRAERRRAEAAGEAPNFIPLLRAWGGVSLVYRKGLADSPAYRLNHEEIVKSLEEGISYVENLEPVEAIPDRFGAVSAVRFLGPEEGTGEGGRRSVTLPARSVMVAAGTVPNITYEKERAGTFRLDAKGRFFLGHRAARGADGRFHPVPAAAGERAFFTSYEKDGRLVTFYGDNHPVYAGNVVKAMASARDGFPEITRLFQDDLAALDPLEQPLREAGFARLAAHLADELVVRVDSVVRLTPTIVEVILRAPLAVRQFQPGQFFRLQNYEVDSPVVGDTRLLMEGLALTGAWVDRDAGLLSLIVLEMGASSRLCMSLQPGQRVVAMGPTGAPTEIPAGENVLLAGGGLGNAVLFSIARAMRDAGNRVLYFAGYKRGEDLFKREEIEAACDQIIWSTDSGAEIEPRRPQDRHFRGNIVQAMVSYGEGRLGEALIPLSGVSRVIAIGSDRMMAAVKEARHAILAPLLPPGHVALGSINSLMQCMMKEVCAQCLQRHVDPATGRETGFVFTCAGQDQCLDEVDFSNLTARLKTNSLQEKIANLWLDHLQATEPRPEPDHAGRPQRATAGSCR